MEVTSSFRVFRVLYWQSTPRQSCKWCGIRIRIIVIVKIKNYLQRTPANINIEKVLIVLAALYFFLIVVNIALNTPFVYDSALHAIFSKNFANGYGWAESYHGKAGFLIYTTGPAITIPGALFIAVLGNKIWVPALTVCLINFSLVSVVAYQLRKIILDKNVYYSFLAGLGFFLVFYDNYWWGYYLGEISSFFLLLLGCVYLSAITQQNIRRNLFIFGVLASISLDAKVMSAPGLAGITGILMLMIWILDFYQQKSIGAKIKLTLMLMGGFFAAQIPFRLFEIINMALDGRYTYLEYLRFRHDIVTTRTLPGLQSLFGGESVFLAFFKNVSYEYEKLSEIFVTYGYIKQTFLLLLAFSIVGVVLLFKKISIAERQLIFFLAGGFASYFLWYFLLTHIIFDRHAVQVMLLFFVCVLFITARGLGWKGVLIMMVVAVLTAAPEKRANFFRALVFKDPSGGENTLYNKDIIDTKNYVLNNPTRFPLANCGWMGATREIEFLLPQSDNFKNCYRLIREALVPNESGSGYHWEHPVNFTLLINNVSWTMSKSHENNKKTQPLVMKACKQNIVYENALFRLMDCPFENLQKFVPLDQGTPFMDNLGMVISGVTDKSMFRYPEN